MFEMVGTSVHLSQGDSGLITIAVDVAQLTDRDRAVFTLAKALRGNGDYKKIGPTVLEAVLTPDTKRNVFQMPFVHEDTKELPVGKYLWDVRVYIDAEMEDGWVTGGQEVLTPFKPSRLTVERTVG